MDMRFLTTQQILAELGTRLREKRIQRNLDQKELAQRADLSLRAIRNLEQGQGSNLETFLRVLKALDAIQGLEALVPIPTIDPLALLKQATPRQRVRNPKKVQP